MHNLLIMPNTLLELKVTLKRLVRWSLEKRSNKCLKDMLGKDSAILSVDEVKTR